MLTALCFILSLSTVLFPFLGLMWMLHNQPKVEKKAPVPSQEVSDEPIILTSHKNHLAMVEAQERLDREIAKEGLPW